MTTLRIPDMSFVILVGASGAGKTTFARRCFKPTQVLSSDFFRGLICDDETSQAATAEAFETLRFVARKRLAAGKLTVVDATNVRPEDRAPFVQMAREFHCLPVAIAFDVPEALCFERNQSRPDRHFGRRVIGDQIFRMRRSIRRLGHEGFGYVHVLESPAEVETAHVEIVPLWSDRRGQHGAFDIIGDVHGCFHELLKLLETLGYEIDQQPESERSDDALPFPVSHPAGRTAIFLGDLVDRGPATPAVLRLVMSMVASGAALCVPGNHDVRLVRKFRGKDVKITHGLEKSIEQLEREPPEFVERAVEFLGGLVSHYVLDDGKLVVAHAGMKETMQGRASGAVRSFALYGETTGETDEYGLPVRHDWASEYRGSATVVYGHTPVTEAEWLNNTICIDTGCVFGGRLTALRYPERQIVSVPAARVWSEPVRPIGAAPEKGVLGAQQIADDVLDISDVLGRRTIHTALSHGIAIREENAAAALEVMSRFAVNPKWLMYLPPTMSPSETSDLAGLLEHPREAFAYYRKRDVSTVVCEEKHMGSRAVVIVCRDPDVVRKRFGIESNEIGVCYTRTGRPFFADEALGIAFLSHMHEALTNAGIWEALDTNWICLDCEIMPWSVKAMDLIRGQYAAVGAAAKVALKEALETLRPAAARNPELGELLAKTEERSRCVDAYADAYRRYWWPVTSVDQLRVAPFHVLASENAVHSDKDHLWHMRTISSFCEDGSILLATNHRAVDLSDEVAVNAAIEWFEQLTKAGGEGIVVKPLEFVARGDKGLIQPALKCRGAEYLRIIYGPEYTLPEHLERLRHRSLGAKRSLALREFALGIEALTRFVRREPLRRIHECVFAVLALESEPVDPRL